MKYDFQFPVKGHAPMGIRGWLIRYFARQVSMNIADASNGGYQMGGWYQTGGLTKRTDYYLLQVDKYQLIHWILFEAGYLCSPADVMERCGVAPERKAAPENTLDICNEVPWNEPPWKHKNMWLRKMPIHWLRKY